MRDKKANENRNNYEQYTNGNVLPIGLQAIKCDVWVNEKAYFCGDMPTMEKTIYYLMECSLLFNFKWLLSSYLLFRYLKCVCLNYGLQLMLLYVLYAFRFINSMGWLFAAVECIYQLFMNMFTAISQHNGKNVFSYNNWISCSMSSVKEGWIELCRSITQRFSLNVYIIALDGSGALRLTRSRTNF